jgi:S-adenosylmethionine hydrolase
VRQGALVLRNTLPYMPVGVHVAVVDPQVGTERRAIALRTGDGRILVGPDNGLLSLAWERCEGVDLAVDITRSPHRLEPVSATFHGRDIFAPVGAWLARGAELADAGDPLDPETLARVETPHPRAERGAVVAHALVIDHFGNVGLNVDHDRLAGHRHNARREGRGGGGGRALPGHLRPDLRRREPGELLVYEDAYRTLAVPSTAATRRARSRSPRTRGAATPALIGTPRVHHRRTDSTNERAKALAQAGAPHGALVSADDQSAGRGRHGRSVDRAARLRPARVARAARARRASRPAAADRRGGDLPCPRAIALPIKWPNDIWVERQSSPAYW